MTTITKVTNYNELTQAIDNRAVHIAITRSFLALDSVTLRTRWRGDADSLICMTDRWHDQDRSMIWAVFIWRFLLIC